MAKRLSSELIIGNAIMLLYEKEIEINTKYICDFASLLDSNLIHCNMNDLLKEKYYCSIASFEKIEEFCENYAFLVKKENLPYLFGDKNRYFLKRTGLNINTNFKITLINNNETYDRMLRYFRMGLPKELIEIFYKSLDEIKINENEKIEKMHKILEKDYQDFKITEETIKDIKQNPLRYSKCPVRCQLGLIYTDEEKEKYINKSLKKKLP